MPLNTTIAKGLIVQQNQNYAYPLNLPNSSILYTMLQPAIRADLMGADAVVGLAADVTNGRADYSSIQSAITAVTANGGSRILVLPGTYTENVSLSAKMNIRGVGSVSYLNGTFTLASGASLSMIKWIRFGDNITINSGVNNCFLRECWQITGKTITNSGTNNSILLIQE